MATRSVRKKLFPHIAPYRTDFLHVGNGHRIYYEECGNPEGLPVLYLHGGPGSGCDKESRRFFDPKICRVILFDQRGSGRSTPYTRIYANTTWYLLEDIEKLRSRLGIQKFLLFGGSWGSTLALVYAETHPENVSGMVLRGIFFGEEREILDYKDGIRQVCSRFPEAWKRFISHVPLEERHNPAKYYFSRLISGDSEMRKKYAYEWSYYEMSRSNLVSKNKRGLHQSIVNSPYESLSVMEAHYFMNSLFLEDGFIINNAKLLQRVPVSIIHGRYDGVCDVENARRLHRVLPDSRLHIVAAGHARSDPEILKNLVSETDIMVKRLEEKQKCNIG